MPKLCARKRQPLEMDPAHEDAERGGEGASPSEVASLPSRLDLSDSGGEENEGAVGAASVGGDLVLEDALAELLNEGGTVADREVDTLTAPARGPQTGATSVPGAMSHVSRLVQVSLLRRRGRPNAVLREALAEGLAETVGSSQVAELGDVLARGRALQASRQQEAAAAAKEARDRRQKLLEAATLQDSRLQELRKRPLNGLMPLPHAAEAVAAAAFLGALPNERLDADVLAASTELLGPTPMMMASKRMRSDKLGVPEEKLVSMEAMLSSAIVLLDREGRTRLEKLIAYAMSRSDLLFYIDQVAYDETPLPVALKKQGAQIGEAGKAEPEASSSTALGTAQPLDSNSLLGQKLSTTAGPQKLFSLMQAGGLLVSSGGQHVGLIFHTLSPLSLLDSGTGASVAAAAMQLSGASRASSAFAHCCRVACTDRASANYLCERTVSAERGEQWLSVHVACEAHKAATCHETTFSLVDTEIKGMIHVVLALQNGKAMSTFRECVREEIDSRLVLRFGVVSLAAKEYKQFMMDLFVGRGRQLALRRVLLALCPNGDWRRQEVEFYLPPDCEWSRAQVLEHVSSGVLTALCSSQPPLYKRSRWTGADLAVDALGIMEVCHRLLSSSFLRFAATFEKGARAQALMSAAAKASSAIGRLPVGPRLAAEPLPGPTEAEDLGRDTDATPEALRAIAVLDPRSDEPDWQVINAKHRRVGSEWVMSRPLSMLVLLRLALEPLRRLLSSILEVAGEEWEMEQRAKVAAKLQCGVAHTTDRSYRLAIAAQGLDEARCFDELQQLFDRDQTWQHMPTEVHNVEFRALSFRMLSKVGCMVEELFAQAHRCFPIRLCVVLAAPEQGPELATVPDCVLDEWSRRLKVDHPEFTGEAFLQKVSLLALMCPKDISHIEARHASIRRLLTSASVQTHTQSLDDLSAQWCLMQFRRRRRRGALGQRKVASRPQHKACIGSEGGSELAGRTSRAQSS